MPLDEGLKSLYNALILEHDRRPRNEGPLEGATHEASEDNPLCGDEITVRLSAPAGAVDAARFEGRGCALSRASASLMTEALAGKGLAEALALADAFEASLEGRAPAPSAGLEAFAGVRDFPSRVGCATLAWRALRGAIGGGGPAPGR
ncbi:MAG TPA: SUF system NifU family Fe-S cluster assembly protein [Polyangiaceae bacterium]|nr:SUF system NifU family Fe-S cluster assembly protein [Polyangiaceae bacterium]